MKKISIVVPVYYNHDNLLPLYADLKEKVFTKMVFSSVRSATRATRLRSPSWRPPSRSSRWLPLKAIAPRPMARTRLRSRRSIRLSPRVFCTRTRLLTARALWPWSSTRSVNKPMRGTSAGRSFFYIILIFLGWFFSPQSYQKERAIGCIFIWPYYFCKFWILR